MDVAIGAGLLVGVLIILMTGLAICAKILNTVISKLIVRNW